MNEMQSEKSNVAKMSMVLRVACNGQSPFGEQGDITEVTRCVEAESKEFVTACLGCMIVDATIAVSQSYAVEVLCHALQMAAEYSCSGSRWSKELDGLADACQAYIERGKR